MEYFTKEIICKNQDKSIFGIAYIPKTDKKVPLVIFAHELGSSHKVGKKYAERFVQMGIAYYVFDFCGGSAESFGNKSDGEPTDMSVLTELTDLEAVFDTAKTWDFVDTDRILFHGASQGGLTQALLAAKRPNEVFGLVLMYPAFSINRFVRNLFKSWEEVPEKFYYLDLMWVGKVYFEAVWEMDVFKEIAPYEGPVLLLHGDADKMVLPEMSVKANEVYKNSELHLIPEGVHGFSGEPLNQAYKYIEEFYQKYLDV